MSGAPIIQPVLELSTRHLTLATHRWLLHYGKDTADAVDASYDFGKPKWQPKYWVATTLYGWLVFADEEPTLDDFPADLIACMKKARELGAEYILFDSDSDRRADGLPIYNEAYAEEVT